MSNQYIFINKSNKPSVCSVCRTPNSFDELNKSWKCRACGYIISWNEVLNNQIQDEQTILKRERIKRIKDIISPQSSYVVKFTNIDGLISFGKYYWRILDITDRTIFILSEDIIESKAYHNRNQDITWEHCNLREYLNTNFYNRFITEEKEIIVNTTVKNDDNDMPEVMNWRIKKRFVPPATPGGNDTADKVFILSVKEILKYLKNNKDRVAKLNNKNATWWWLRSPGTLSHYAAHVEDDGSLHYSGSLTPSFWNGDGGVRLALWLKF